VTSWTTPTRLLHVFLEAEVDFLSDLWFEEKISWSKNGICDNGKRYAASRLLGTSKSDFGFHLHSGCERVENAYRQTSRFGCRGKRSNRNLNSDVCKSPSPLSAPYCENLCHSINKNKPMCFAALVLNDTSRNKTNDDPPKMVYEWQQPSLYTKRFG